MSEDPCGCAWICVAMRNAGRGLLTAVLCLCLQCAVVTAQGLSPEQSLQQLRVADGIRAELVAAEPLVRQPVAMEFDDRGRLWVIQYLQYPNPEGLQRVQVDRYSRTKYDRVPEPPPRGPRGADRITILEDTDGDGRMDAGRDFVSGLNLATGLAFGNGGVYVLQVPYLLFYADRDRDDVPDGDPQVLLTGFGMEDAHSVANSLTWGPDGWLYGCQGSTVTASIRGQEFQQGVWRYHPRTDVFELFCEGGGNSWGLDFDATGRLFYSTNYGGYVLVHGLQGAYYVKSFGKHGALHNAHAYGYFEHALHENFRGGHVTVGGIVYQERGLPQSLRGRYVAGDLLGHGVYWHTIHSRGSTVSTAHGGELLQSADTWFAPTDVTTGPDGAVYVADWHDARTAHPDPDADWDRSNGRIYRLISGANERPVVPDFVRLSAEQLWQLHSDERQWYVRKARCELARRMAVNPDAAELQSLRQRLKAVVTGSAVLSEALEGLWSLHVLGGVDESVVLQLLSSPHAAVRGWAVRLTGDSGVVSELLAHRLDEFAEQESDVGVLQQLAATAARLPAAVAMPVINANINRDDHGDDPCLPLLWWWAVERHSVSGRAEVLRRFVRPTLWQSRLGRDVLLPRLIRRYAAEGTVEGLDAVAQLLKAAPGAAERRGLWDSVVSGWQERRSRGLEAGSGLTSEQIGSHETAALLLADWRAEMSNLSLLRAGLLAGQSEPRAWAVQSAFDGGLADEVRIPLLDVLSQSGSADLSEAALAVVVSDQSEAVRSAALRVLANSGGDESVAKALTALHQRVPASALNSQLRDVLLSRVEWARQWLLAVDAGQIPAAATSLEQIRRVALFGDAGLDVLVAKHWGRLQGSNREERLAEVRRLNNDLRAGAGHAGSGKDLFRRHCAACHQLFGEGNRVGPDLTTANRQDRDFLLISLVDPSSVIRREYVSVVVQTQSGRVLTGLPIQRSESQLVLADAKGERQEISTAEIEDLQESPVSLMPEDLYRQLNPQQLRDLFAYLQSGG